MSLIYFLLRDAYAALKGIPVDWRRRGCAHCCGHKRRGRNGSCVILVPAIGKILLSLKRRNSRS